MSSSHASMFYFLRPRYLITAAAIALAALVLAGLWRDYLYTPWTRDGRVNAEVVKVAPEVSDNLISLPVVDNQVVHKGDIIAVIDPARYREILAEREAAVVERKQDLDERLLEANRRDRLLQSNAVSVEEEQVAKTALITAQAQYDDAVAARNLAKIDLDRTVIRSPVNGWIVNFHTRVGDYASPGQPILTILDSDSFWIAAYIEETRLAHVQPGDRADIRLMGIGRGVEGHVESLGGGIQDENEANFTGLASVNPIFTWVRLAQRMPIRIHIDHVAPGVHLYVSETCTVYLHTRS